MLAKREAYLQPAPSPKGRDPNYVRYATLGSTSMSRIAVYPRGIWVQPFGLGCTPEGFHEHLGL